MSKKNTRASSNIGVPQDFETQNLLEAPMDDVCTFMDKDITTLQKFGAFLDTVVLYPYDRNAKSDFVSSIWVCFLYLPFQLGLKYPFPEFIRQFFDMTGMAYAQAMPEVWKILIVCNRIVENNGIPLQVGDLSTVYKLRTHGPIGLFFS